MEFEWDERKAARNLAKHGVPFEYAAGVFLDLRRLDGDDLRPEYSEEQRLTFGTIEGRVFAVAYAPHGGVLRLISARKANEREQRKSHEALPTCP